MKILQGHTSLDHEYVRRDYTCPLCQGPKDSGLLLCWACHRGQKRRHDGCYDAKAEAAIEARERYLIGQELAYERRRAIAQSMREQKV